MIREVDTRDATFIRGDPERQDEITAVADQVSNGPGMPSLAVARLNPATATVAELRCSGGSPREAESLTLAAQDYVQATRSALGSGPEDVVDFVPDPVVQHTSTGAAVVQLRQMYRGVPVFQMTRTVIFARDGRRVTKVKGDHAPLPVTLGTVPVADPVRAVQAAGLFVAEPCEEGEAGELPLPEGWEPRVVAAFALPSQPTVVDAEPFVGLTPAHLVVFYQGPAAILGWHILLTFPPTETRFGEQCVVVVTADEAEPKVLFCRSTARTVVEGEVFKRDPNRTPRARITFPVPAPTYGLPVQLPQFPKDWCYRDETDGRNARAVTEEMGQPARATSTGSNILFVTPDDDNDDQHLINAFYFCNYLHDHFELLGFDEAAGNFEAGSATATGAEGDPVLVKTYARPLLGFAYMRPSPDCSSPELGLGSHPHSHRHSALDFTLVAHEYAHGVTERLVPGDDSALTQPQSRGLDEGTSDLVALSIVNFNRPADEPELQVVGEWFVDSADGMRRHRYDASYPGTYGMLGTAEYSKRHDIGELWCATMMELIRRWHTRFGNDAYQLCWRMVLDSLKTVHSPPSLLDARDALEEALDLLRDTPGELSNDDHAVARQLLWETFARFGMGFGATTNGASLQGIVESKQVPTRVA
jgi:extracellular elastinolytic metalloproteinase